MKKGRGGKEDCVEESQPVEQFQRWFGQANGVLELKAPVKEAPVLTGIGWHFSLDACSLA